MSPTGTKAWLIDDHARLDLHELCKACAAEHEDIIALIEEGALDPLGAAPEQWRFTALHLRQARIATRLLHDLGINPPGVALALQLLDELEQLRARDAERNRAGRS